MKGKTILHIRYCMLCSLQAFLAEKACIHLHTFYVSAKCQNMNNERCEAGDKSGCLGGYCTWTGTRNHVKPVGDGLAQAEVWDSVWNLKAGSLELHLPGFICEGLDSAMQSSKKALSPPEDNSEQKYCLLLSKRILEAIAS